MDSRCKLFPVLELRSFVLLHSFTDQLLGVWHSSRAGDNKDRTSWSLLFLGGEPISNQQMHNKVSDGDLCYEGKRQSKERGWWIVRAGTDRSDLDEIIWGPPWGSGIWTRWVREGANHICVWGRNLLSQGTASSKVQRQDHVWCVGGPARRPRQVAQVTSKWGQRGDRVLDHVGPLDNLRTFVLFLNVRWDFTVLIICVNCNL